jgi:hypothetical protein
MKQKKVRERLLLKKITSANLNSATMIKVQGGLFPTHSGCRFDNLGKDKHTKEVI